MRDLRAVLWKDLRLLRTRAGLVSVLLPALLLVCLGLGLGDSLQRAYVEPFPIAVRDEDETIMSRSLLGQMERLELFSQVVRAGEESDGALLDRGCAAVVTIPKDFFYTMYRMDNSVVEVSLNEEMPLEAQVFRTMFASVMEIVASDQAVGQAVSRFCYGELSEEETARMWEETSSRIITDALGRHQVFSLEEAAVSAGEELRSRLLACTLSVLCLFFSLSAVKVLPEEIASGIYARYLAAGGRRWAFLLSKLIAAGLMALPALVLVLAIFRPERWGMTLLLSALLFLWGFLLLLCVTIWAGAAAAQRWGNVILLLSLLLGGALYAPELLPASARLVGELALPRWALNGVRKIAAGGDLGALMAALLPAWGVSALLVVLTVLGLRRGERPRKGPPPAAAGAEPGPVKVNGLAGRMAGLSAWKAKAMSGGAAGLVCLLLVCALCGGLGAAALRDSGPDSLRLAVCLPEGDALARELTDALEVQPGLSVAEVSGEESRALLAAGDIEGLLTLKDGYAQALAEGDAPPLTYTSAVGAASDQAAREIVAGQVSAQRARLRGLADAEARLGRGLTGEERAALLADMTAAREGLGPLYRETGRAGRALSEDLFRPSLLGLTALAVLLTALTWGAWTGRTDARRVEGRMGVLPGGMALSYGSDALALLGIALAAGLCVLLPGGVPDGWSCLALLGYGSCVTGAVLALSRGRSAERMDVLAPFAALITSLAGGCFGDLSGLSPALRTVSALTPQGLALRAAAGSLPALAVLLAAGGALLALGAPRRAARAR